MSAFGAAIDAYLEELKVARRCSPHTVSNYARDLKAIAAAAGRRGLDDWPSLDADDVRAIVAEQHRSGIAGRSLARRLSALRGLYGHLMRHGETERQPRPRHPRPARRAAPCPRPSIRTRSIGC